MAKAKEEKKLSKADLEIEKQAEQLVAEETSHKIEDLIETEAIAEEIVKIEHELDEEQKGAAKTAKAGKRSAKAQKEAEELKAKEERKSKAKSLDEEESKPKVTAKPPRSRLERSGKKLREATKLIDKSKVYSLNEAVDLAVKTSTTKFDSSVELHVNLSVDPRQADQNIRGTLVLPSGTGKSVRVAVLADVDDAKKALSAGADLAGLENLLAELDKVQINFDVLIATPMAMGQLGKYARLLGPKGLMPNPKSGTVTTNVENAVKEAKAGRVEYRVDETGIVHLAFGKVSFGPEKLLSNAEAVVASIKSAKPASVKGGYIKSAFISTTMGPSIKVQINE